ncbi:MAG TPA: hypothetical protein VF175_01045, partial [Lacipirellula sp.]
PRFREIPIAVVPGSEQRHPVVSENWIAWQDDRATPIVHGVRAEDRATGTEFWVSPMPNRGVYHSRPQLSGDLILWQGNPNATGTLFYDDLSNSNPQRLYTQSTHQFLGDIAGDLVVWHETTGNPLVEGNVYGTRLGSGVKFPISTTNRVHGLPRTDGRFVVWNEFLSSNISQGSGIFMKDLETGASMQLYDRGTSPAIDDGVVAFAARGGVAIRNLLTGQNMLLPTANIVQDGSVAISKNIVVFSQYDSPLGSPFNLDLWGANIHTGEQFLISGGPGNQYWPDIHGSMVVWNDDRNGDLDVYAAMIPEPAAFSLAAIGLIVLFGRRGRGLVAEARCCSRASLGHAHI